MLLDPKSLPIENGGIYIGDLVGLATRIRSEKRAGSLLGLFESPIQRARQLALGNGIVLEGSEDRCTFTVRTRKDKLPRRMHRAWEYEVFLKVTSGSLTICDWKYLGKAEIIAELLHDPETENVLNVDIPRNCYRVRLTAYRNRQSAAEMWVPPIDQLVITILNVASIPNEYDPVDFVTGAPCLGQKFDDS
jgi:hypothetical protein